MDKPKISIITVSFNAAKTIEQTILSVVNQTYENVEYIIIDGGSTDGTVDIIKKYEDKIAYWVSEPDKGIYDAMNKGSIVANGIVLFYLNSGDLFFSINIIDEVAENIMSKGYIGRYILIGSVVCTYHDEFMGVVSPSLSINAWYTPPHQAIFISKQLYREYFFRNEYSILGDRELWLRLNYNQVYVANLIDLKISYYDLSGISSDSNNMIKLYKEATSLYFLYHKFYFLEFFFKLVKGFIHIVLIRILNRKIYYKLLYKIKSFL